MARVAVYLEIAPKRSFAGGVDWPGWCRRGRDEDEALEALVAYAERYARAVGKAAGFTLPAGPQDLEVVERLSGGSGTEFGVPSVAPAADSRDLDDAELERQGAIQAASWRAFDRAAAAAEGRELRLGPRGGGRSLEKIRGHVAEAEAAYVKQLGSRVRWDADGDHDAQLSTLRSVAAETLAARAQGRQVPNPSAVKRTWSPRYYLRRSVWHILDHAWELEDRII